MSAPRGYLPREASIPPAPLAFAPGALVGGKYRIERELGAGGVGVVMLATHVELGQRVAIKYMRQAGSANARSIERFKREAKLAACLRTEHAVKVHDVGVVDDGTPYMVMERLEGEDLGAVLLRGPIPIAQAVEWTREACRALEEAHELGIVHRDLKPANLFLARRPDGSTVVKVLDFGISKITEQASGEALTGLGLLPSMTRQNETFGTPYYMSPEQLVSSTNVDRRSDVWAMGVCLYELLTARLPFENEDLRELVTDVLSSTPRPIRDHRPDIPIELAQVVHACLMYDPEQRPRTMGQLASRLAPFSSSEYVRQVALAETSPDDLGIQDLGWGRTSAGRGPTSPSLPPALPSRRPYVVFAVGGATLALGALALGFALVRSPPVLDQKLVAGASPHEVAIAIPIAIPVASPTSRTEILELPAEADAGAPPPKAPVLAPRPVLVPAVRAARPPALEQEFGGRR